MGQQVGRNGRLLTIASAAVLHGYIPFRCGDVDVTSLVAHMQAAFKDFAVGQGAAHNECVALMGVVDVVVGRKGDVG